MKNLTIRQKISDRSTMNSKIGLFFALYFVFLSNAFASAVSDSFSYQGQFLNSAGTGPLLSVVDLTLGIYDPSGTCLLYEEKQTGLDLSVSGGVFSVQVGSAVGASQRDSNDHGLSMDTIFANTPVPILAAASPNCTNGYTPSATDVRELRVTVTPEDTGVPSTLSPDLVIGSTPYAKVAESIQGILPTGIIQVIGNVTQANLTTLTGGSTTDASALHNHDSLYVKLGTNNQSFNLGSNTTLSMGNSSTLGLGTGSLLGLGTFSTTPSGLGISDQGKTWYNTSTNEVDYWNGTTSVPMGGTGTTSVTLGGDVTGASGSNTLSSVGTPGTYTKVTTDSKGRVISGTSLSSSDVTTALNFTPLSSTGATSYSLLGATSGSLSLTVPATVTSYSLKWPSAVASSSGQVLSSDASGNLSWTSPTSGSVTSVALSAPSFLSVTGSPITSSGTLSMSLATQTQNSIFAAPNGSTGTPSFRSLVGADLPTPSSSSLGGVQSLAPTSSKWINSISTSGIPTASQPAFTDLTGTATVAQGGTGTTSLTSNGILLGGGTGAISATATGTSGQVLTSNGTSAPTFQALPSSVSSVGASAPLASSGGTTPTISLTGTIPVANGGTGSASALTPGGILYGNSSTATGTTAAGSSGSVLISNGTSAPSWTATPSFSSISSSTQNLNGATAGTLSLTVPATVTSYSLKWPSAVASSSGQVLSSDASGNLSWTSPTSGSVTSVALSAPSFLSVSGSPLTSSGTLSMSLATQTQNSIFAAPNGSTGTPSFRSLVGADLPLPSSSTLGGVESIASVLTAMDQFYLHERCAYVYLNLLSLISRALLL